MNTRQRFIGRSAIHSWMGAMLLGLYLAVLLMACCGTIHRQVHADAGDPQHRCAVTLLMAGNLDVPPPLEVLSSPVGAFLFVTPELASFHFAHVRTLLPVRGPPVEPDPRPVAV